MTHIRKIPLAAAALLSVATLSAPAAAQDEPMTVCATRDKIVEKLENHFKETRRSYGLQKEAGVFEVFASEAGSWTMILTQPTGVTCVLAAGEAWSNDKSSVLLEGDPA